MWSQILEQTNDEKIGRLISEIEDKFEAILKEIRSNKSVSTMTNPRSETNGMQNTRPSGSKNEHFIGVHASDNENTDSENGDFPIRTSEMVQLRFPSKPVL